MLTIGFIINPVAGMGGRVGLHGTDGEAVVQAVCRGAAPVAGARAARALKIIAQRTTDVRFLTAGGTMGADVALLAGICAESVTLPCHTTTARDTAEAAQGLLVRRVDLLLFAGGDGTATDIVKVVGEQLPVLGIPSGVKMHSSVFATSPEAAADAVVALAAAGESITTRRREVLDTPRDGELEPRSLLSAMSPDVPSHLQSAKSMSAPVGDGSLDVLCCQIAHEMDPQVTYFIGPGTTTDRVLRALHCAGTINGVDVVRDGTIVCADATEEQLLRYSTTADRTEIILGVIGGQGFLLGRGNQQISSDVVDAVGEDNVTILASEDKLRLLDPPILRIDTGVGEPRPVLLGYRRVRTGPGRSTVFQVVAQ